MNIPTFCGGEIEFRRQVPPLTYLSAQALDDKDCLDDRFCASLSSFAAKINTKELPYEQRPCWTEDVHTALNRRDITFDEAFGMAIYQKNTALIENLLGAIPEEKTCERIHLQALNFILSQQKNFADVIRMIQPAQENNEEAIQENCEQSKQEELSGLLKKILQEALSRPVDPKIQQFINNTPSGQMETKEFEDQNLFYSFYNYHYSFDYFRALVAANHLTPDEKKKEARRIMRTYVRCFYNAFECKCENKIKENFTSQNPQSQEFSFLLSALKSDDLKFLINNLMNNECWLRNNDEDHFSFNSFKKRIHELMETEYLLREYPNPSRLNHLESADSASKESDSENDSPSPRETAQQERVPDSVPYNTPSITPLDKIDIEPGVASNAASLEKIDIEAGIASNGTSLESGSKTEVTSTIALIRYLCNWLDASEKENLLRDFYNDCFSYDNRFFNSRERFPDKTVKGVRTMIKAFPCESKKIIHDEHFLTKIALRNRKDFLDMIYEEDPLATGPFKKYINKTLASLSYKDRRAVGTAICIAISLAIYVPSILWLQRESQENQSEA